MQPESLQKAQSSGVSFPIRVRAEGSFLPGSIQAVSRRGVLLHTEQAVPIGTPVQLIFYTTRCAALVVQGRVSWLEPQGGCGILFLAMPTFASTMLTQLIMPSMPGQSLAQAS